MKPISLIVLCVLGAVGQTPARGVRGERFGAIDGISLPAHVLNGSRDAAVRTFILNHGHPPASAAEEQEVQSIHQKRVCDDLHFAIHQASRDRAKTDLGVVVSDSEVEAQRQKLMANVDFNAIWKREHERTLALVTGLSAVYDQGQDQEKVYQEMIAPHGISEAEWAQHLYAQRSKQARSALAQHLSDTSDTFAKLAARDAPDSARRIVESGKLDAAIDARIAADDSTFRAYLSEWNKQGPNGQRTIPAEHRRYLDEQRAAWWRAETAKLNVTLSDPSLYTACQLPAVGVTAPTH